MRRSRYRSPSPEDFRSDEVSTIRTLLKAVVFDGYEYGLLTTYFTGSNEVLKLHGGKYIEVKDHPYYRYWRFRKRQLQDEAKELFDGLCVRSTVKIEETFDQFLQKINDASTTPHRTAFIFGLKGTIYPVSDGSVVLVSTYHTGLVSIAHNMGAAYLPPMKAWKFPATSAPILKNNLVLELGVADDQIAIFDGLFDIVDDNFSPVKSNEISIQIGGDFPEGDGKREVNDEEGAEVYLSATAPLLPSTLSDADIETAMVRYALYDYQRAGVRHLVSNTSALLADDMGLGKSRQAIVAADILTQGKYKVLIACPASLIVNWTREIRMILPDAEIAAQCYTLTARWVVTNYERLEGLTKVASEFMVMITDEVHFLKEPHVKRTRLTFDIASKIPYRFLLTGTPIPNRESELHTLLRLSGHPIGQMPLKEFEKQFSGNADFRSVLNQRIQQWMLRRMKDMVLTTLKGKQQQVFPVAVDGEKWTEYEKIIRDTTLYSLQKVIRLRQWLEEVKLPVAVGMIQEMQGDDKVLVFCEFKDSVAEFHRRLTEAGIRAVTLTGDDSPTKRQKTVDAFQADPEIRVFICTTMAGGVGLNLTAANYVIFASLPWTPALKEQAEDRAYRNGQQRLVIVKIPLVENSIDSMLWEMLAHKKAIANEVLTPHSVQQSLVGAMHLKAA